METILYQPNRAYSRLLSPPNSCRNFHGRARLAMPLTDLVVRRIADRLQIRFDLSNLSILNNSITLSICTMADEEKRKNTQPAVSESIASNIDSSKENAEEVEKKPEKSTPAVPPQPEKPLPGDCCGSGCVRCVWDVYYEELEEYNKLYKSNSKPS